MGIGEHQPLAINHHTGTLAPLTGAGGGIAKELAQQGIAEGRIQPPRRHIALRIDPHHRGRHPLNRFGDKTAGLGQGGHSRLDSSRGGGQGEWTWGEGGLGLLLGGVKGNRGRLSRGGPNLCRGRGGSRQRSAGSHRWGT